MPAKENAKMLVPHRSPDLDIHSDWILVDGDTVSRIDKRGDSSPRPDVVARYLKNVLTGKGIRGYFPVNYEDAWDGNDNVLLFSRRKGQRCPLMPDMYQMLNYGSIIHNLVDDIPFHMKKNKVIFTGSSTGNSDPAKNERIRQCIWSVENSDISNYRISSIVQMQPESFAQHAGLLLSKIHQPFRGNDVSMREQLTYKYIASIDGNTACWDRPVWITKSNSILFQYPTQYEMWYSAYMRHHTHYVQVDESSVRHHVKRLDNEYGLCANIVKNAQAFCKTYCLSDMHKQYTVDMFEESAHLYSP